MGDTIDEPTESSITPELPADIREAILKRSRDRELFERLAPGHESAEWAAWECLSALERSIAMSQRKSA